MPDAALQLRSTPADSSLIGQVPEIERVGLDGALADAGYRMRRALGRGRLTELAYGWRFADQWTGIWWPQGIAVGDYDGAPISLVSWYAKQDRHGVRQGSRISVVDLRVASKPGYSHVLLVAPRATTDGVVLDPVLVHAGGIAWSGDRLLVAATRDGLLEFRLSDIYRLRSTGPFGYQLVLPVAARHVPADPEDDERLRYSFLTVETGSAIRSDSSSLRLVAGEFAHDTMHRLVQLSQNGDRMDVTETLWPEIERMQGAALHNGTWYVTSSNGDRLGGDLWTGTAARLTKQDRALPPGPEALAVWPERNQLWSVSEVPGRRYLYAMDLAKIGSA